MQASSSDVILIVDNEPAILAALDTRLRSRGYRCITASCGRDAIARFQESSPQLVISDLEMPGGDGVSLAQSIREFSAVPIILISGYKDLFRKQLRQVSDVSFLHKPFTTATLLEVVEAALQRLTGEPQSAAA